MDLIFYLTRSAPATEKQAHSLREGKLRTYLKIKTNFGYENYLSIIKNFEQRRRLSKLRI
jgi:hypothetical protein